MKIKLTLIHEPGEDREAACDLGGGVILQYPQQGHIVVHSAHVTLASDEYETLGSVNKVHAAGAAELVEAPPIDTAKDTAIEPLEPAQAGDQAQADATTQAAL